MGSPLSPEASRLHPDLRRPRPLPSSPLGIACPAAQRPGEPMGRVTGKQSFSMETFVQQRIANFHGEYLVSSKLFCCCF